MTRRLAAVAVVLVLLLFATYVAVRRQTTAIRDRFGASAGGRTTVAQSLVVERVRAVAQLVSSETAVRDVVTYENTWYGSTKRSLVVVTGRILAGINLERGSETEIDEAARTISITLPRAEILAVDVGDMRTYDERGGLWNPFTPADRDAILRLARAQIAKSGYEMKILEHAESSARRALESLFAAEGWRTTVSFAPRLREGGAIDEGGK